MYIDTHAHLFYPQLADNIGFVLDDAAKVGITKIICPGLNKETSLQAVELSQKYQGKIFAAAGIHPSDSQDNNLDFLKSLAAEDKIIAVGEIGVDQYHTGKEDLHRQIELFEAQLAIAKEYNLPALVHGRNACKEILSLAEIKNAKAVIHSFEATYGEAKKFLDAGWLISTAGLITYKNYGWLRDVFMKIPLDRIMIETDAPYLTPQAKKGIAKYNSPANVVEIAKELAQIYKVSVETVADITTKTAEDFFGI